MNNLYICHMDSKTPKEENKLTPLIQHLVDRLEEKNLKIAFGLEAQGHIPTIERMIKEFNAPSDTNPDGEDISHSLYLWDKIAKEIGWDAKTAMAYYIRYLRNKK